MQCYWFAVLVDRMPDNFVDGVVLANGFDGYEDPPTPSELQYAILARASAPTAQEASLAVRTAVQDHKPIAVKMLFDSPAEVTRAERRICNSLHDFDISLRTTFVGFKRDSTEARESAISTIRTAIAKTWRFWR